VKGSATLAILLSLYGTWQAQGQDVWQACRQMLVQTQAAPAAG
jgi:hypothetical protein